MTRLNKRMVGRSGVRRNWRSSVLKAKGIKDFVNRVYEKAVQLSKNRHMERQTCQGRRDRWGMGSKVLFVMNVTLLR